jgi:hypothetical protein
MDKHCLVSILSIIVIVICVLLLTVGNCTVCSKKENFPRRMLRVQAAPSALTPRCVSLPTHMLPQTVPTTAPFGLVSSNLTKNNTLAFNVKYPDVFTQKKAECSSYDEFNAGLPPRNIQSCPNTSFSYVTDLNRYIPGAYHGGCIQLDRLSDGFCFSGEDGKYKPWWDKILKTSP